MCVLMPGFAVDRRFGGPHCRLIVYIRKYIKDEPTRARACACKCKNCVSDECKVREVEGDVYRKAPMGPPALTSPSEEYAFTTNELRRDLIQGYILTESSG